MSEVAQPISLRLAPCHIEQLKARAHTVSGTLTGVARDLILTSQVSGRQDRVGRAESCRRLRRRVQMSMAAQ